MKQRVTDEQAAEIRDGFFQTLIVSREYDENGNETRITARDVAADLLEARELIKKAIEVLSPINEKIDKFDIECGDSYQRIDNVNKIRDLLERTKEYV